MLKKFWLLFVVLLLLVLPSGCGSDEAGPPADGTPPIGVDEDNDDDEEITGPGGAGPVGPPITGVPASSSYEFAGEGFRSNAEGWNCDGLVGEWTWYYELEIIGYGMISGEGTSTFPPPPDSGPWLTEPFSYTLSGTLNMDGATAEVSYIFEDMILEIIVLDNGVTMIDNYSGKGTAIVRVVTDQGTFVVSETYIDVPSEVPSVIVFGPNPRCN